jgi:hypothetical protein
MRETRSSGSVEGVMGNHASYSDCFIAVRIKTRELLPPGAICTALSVDSIFDKLFLHLMAPIHEA